MRLIDADALEQLIDVKGANLGITNANRCNFKDMLKMTPTVDAEPVRHGHWVDGALITEAGKYNAVGCSICRQVFNYPNAKDFIYCPACGAKMDEEVTDD